MFFLSRFCDLLTPPNQGEIFSGASTDDVSAFIRTFLLSSIFDVTWCAVANYNPQFLLFDEVSELKATEWIQQRR